MLKQPRSWLIWILTNGSVAAIFVFGLYWHHAWAWNVARFTLASITTVYLLGMFTWDHIPQAERSKKAENLPARSLLVNADVCYDLALAILLAGAGQFWWAAVQMVQMLLCLALLDKYYALKESAPQNVKQ